ncbi:unnamed protein product [Nippostrongylus brasiliensis]|uniref:non-specific serine/threonine protein kinase n=1 Tax=Nippostrongylus brasiliensis TaxID=27835 RepID=A0A0N4Y2U0_NIPBR|nr:unnamed protein product [Nippostrongylus brasiliensis]
MRLTRTLVCAESRTLIPRCLLVEEHVRSLWNTVWNSCARSDGNPIFNQLNKMSSSSTNTTPRSSPMHEKSPSRKREVCKKVSWSRYDSVNISGHLLMLPRRFANLEIIEAGPSSTILSVLDAFEAGDSLYTVTDMMDGRLADIVDEHLNHFVIAKIVYQLLSALEPLHSNGLYHGNITLNSVFINTDAVLKLSSYGDVMQNAGDDKAKKESFLKLSKIKSYNDLDWRTILQGNAESGLIDFHARNVLYLLLGARCSLSDLLRHPYLLTFRKNVGNVSPLKDPEHRDLSSLSLSDVHG